MSLLWQPRGRNGVPLHPKANSHHTPQQIPPSNMSALFLNKLWVKEEIKAKNIDIVESSDNNSTTQQHLWDASVPHPKISAWNFS